ncbi:hypothetical protein WY02_00160 [Pseudonocardia sp. AL041005-10]|nr:acyl carrier protein [Pseudonocardia sp. AL041005-10]ALE77159.1 hypothetical protein WY02_00160 [Pseudonocardia sp. AL041005-10]
MIEKIRRIWCEQFGRPDIATTDDFFALGGSSIVMMRIQGALMDDLHIDIPIDELYRRPTVAETAQWLENSTVADVGDCPGSSGNS